MKLEIVSRKEETYVELFKDKRFSIGISIKAGTERWTKVKKIKSGSLAERSHSMCRGDAILSVDGRRTESLGVREVCRLVREVGPLVCLRLQYGIREASLSKSGIFRRKTMTLRLKKEAGTFGFVLRKNDAKRPVTVEFPIISIIRGHGPAHRAGCLMDGDRLLRIDNVNLSWMSLTEIAQVLESRDEAEFSIEYKVRVLNFRQQPMNRIELEIDIPGEDLGIVLASPQKEPTQICIQEIRQGSLAERCGAFCVGDTILQINSIDVGFLNAAKANSLLQSFRKYAGKISFCSGQRRKLSGDIFERNLQCGNGSAFDDTTLTAASTHNHNTNAIDTPLGACNARPRKCKMSQTEDNFNSQLRIIGKFQESIQSATQMKLRLSQMANRMFGNIRRDLSKGGENCNFCQKAQHSLKVCSSCLTHLNTVSAQTMASIRDITVHFVNFLGTRDKWLFDGVSDEAVLFERSREDLSGSGVWGTDTIPKLVDSIPKSLVDKAKLSESLATLMEVLGDFNMTCLKCKDEVLSASMSFQELLLLISLNDFDTETRNIIKYLAGRITGSEIPCKGCKMSALPELSHECIMPGCIGNNDSSDTQNTGSSSTSETISDVPSISKVENIVSGSHMRMPHLRLNLAQETAFFRLIDIQSESDTNSLVGTLNQTYTLQQDNENRHPNPAEETSPKRRTRNANQTYANAKHCCKEYTKNAFKDLTTLSSQKGQSVDSFLFQEQRLPLPDTIRCQVYSGDCSQSPHNLNISSHPSKRKEVLHLSSASLGSSISDNTQLSTTISDSSLELASRNKLKYFSSLDFDSVISSSSVAQVKDFKQTPQMPKTYSEVIDVKMKNEGDGFGYSVGFSSPASILPIITAIKPKSPADRCGVVLPRDRLLAIDGRGVAGLSVNELEKIKRETSTADQITLTIEFDVVETEIKFGTFDVSLDKTLKTGLLFGSIRKGSPMRVTGVVKGSAAHRSGEIFPRDQILRLECHRTEEFDPLSFDYRFKELVRLSVRREAPGDKLIEGQQKSL